MSRLWLGLSLISVLACSEKEFGAGSSEDVAQKACFKEQFKQTATVTHRFLDLLFVIDTSASLNDEVLGLVYGLQSFLKEIPEVVDLRIAVVLAHSPDSLYSGRFWQSKLKTEPRVIGFEKTSRAEMERQLFQKFFTGGTTDDEPIYRSYPGENGSDGGELGLSSLNQAVTDYLSENKAQGFFREEAALAVVFLADENDICAKYPVGVKPKPDSEGMEEPAKSKYCGGITASGVLENLVKLKNGLPLTIAGVIYTDPNNIPKDNGVYDGESEVGYGYLDIIQLSGGIAADLANRNFSKHLQDIGNRTADQLLLEKSFVLKPQGPLDITSLQVTIDGQRVSYEYSPNDQTVILSEYLGQAGSTISCSYCLITPVE